MSNKYFLDDKKNTDRIFDVHYGERIFVLERASHGECGVPWRVVLLHHALAVTVGSRHARIGASERGGGSATAPGAAVR